MGASAARMKSWGLGDVSVPALAREATRANTLLLQGQQALLGGRSVEATKGFFAAAALAVNVAFTVRTHGVKLSDRVMNRMEEICSEASDGIAKVMRLVVARKMTKHNRLKHNMPGVTVIKTDKPLALWFRMQKHGIPLRNMRVTPIGVAVTGRTLAEVQKAMSK